MKAIRFTVPAAMALALALLAGPIADTATAPPADAARQVTNPCTRLNHGQVKYNTHEAKRVTFATARTRSSNYVRITSCVKRNGKYQQEWVSSGRAGLRGFAAQGKLWENTWKSPTGSFSVTEALGRKDPGTKLKYHRIKPNSKWGGERTRHYNQYFEGRGGESDENLWRYMNQGYYEQAAVINWNRKPDMTTVRGASFAIFLHAGNTTSAGCISTHLSTVKRFLRTAVPGDRMVLGAVRDIFTSKHHHGRNTGAGLSVASIKSGGDILSAGRSGVLWNYPAAGNGWLNPKVRVKSGFRKAKSSHVVDWNRDRVFDIITHFDNGRLYYYQGKRDGGFRARKLLATGWHHNTITVGKWNRSKPSVLSRDRRGRMLLYTHASRLQSPKVIGKGGWRPYSNFALIDFDKDGKNELATTKGSRLYVYENGMNLKKRKFVGRYGWQRVNSLRAVETYKSEGSRGLQARMDNGQLRYYPVYKNRLGKRSTIGHGWNVYPLHFK
ncbi:L,D-transpeptidase family protein [Arthrobacter pigmenti]